MAGVLAPVIPELAGLVARTPGTLSLAQGMVGWSPPATVAEAVVSLLGGTDTTAQEAAVTLHRYGPVQGDPELLEAIAATLREHHGIEPAESLLCATAGSNMAFQAIAQVICEGPSAGPTEVILPLPYYFNHVMAVQLAGGRPVAVDAGLVADPDRLAAAITPRTRAIVTVSPNNPSGVVMPRPVLEAIGDLCARHGLLHVSDEAYAQFVHGDECHWSPGSRPGSAAHTVTLHSLSKAYGMAGWRLGYMAVPPAFHEALAKVQDTVLICPPRLHQRAAVAALQAGPAWCAPRIAGLAERRRQLLEAIERQRRAGLPVRVLGQPDGAFYALLAVEAAALPSPLSGHELMRRLVLEHRVAAIAGESFGLGQGSPGGSDPVLRLSYGLLSASELEEALRRLFAGLRALLRQRSEQ